MGHVTAQQHVAAPIETVFDAMLRVDRLPESNPFFHKVISGPSDVAGVGNHFVTEMRVLGRAFESEIDVTELVRPTLLTLVGAAPGGGHLRWTRRLSTSGEGTDVESSFDYEVPGHIAGAIADHVFLHRSIERGARHSLENFADLVESGQPPQG